MNDDEKRIAEEQHIDEEFNGLITDYLNSNHRRKVDIITKAFNLAREAHRGARRRSGEPFIMHPLEVARIVSREMGLGSTSISASLLHDVVEDTDYTVEDLRALFGDKIASIVDGLTKISSGMFGDDVSAQAENFRKLLLTMSEDIRVILIKIADRLHNMRTLDSMAPAKQFKITGETMYIYAPLAHRLGLFAIKTELEELSFKYEHPQAFADITHKVEETAPQRNLIYDHFAQPVREALDGMGIKYKMRARVKSIYSIWKKMETKGIEFNEVYDLFAVRIIFDAPSGVDEKKQCWDIYSAITDIYRLRPDRIRDWISQPKSNGYQALHLTVMGPDGKWIEVQIRSRRMDEIAEKGFAAHWKYKETVEEDNELEKWLETIQEILANPNPNAIDFLDTVKMNLFSSEIFVFTPKGEIRTLPQGATALDFAYTVHSRVGDHCLGAKVNHTLVPLSQKLRSGDQIEILTSESIIPQLEWLSFVTTAKAKTKIETSLRRQRRAVIENGQSMLNELFSNELIDNNTFNKILYYYNIDSKDNLFFQIGNGDVLLPADKSDFFKSSAQGKRDNLFVRYMKQAVNAIKKTPAEDPTEIDSTTESIGIEASPLTLPALQVKPKVDRKSVYHLVEFHFKKNFIVPTCCNPLPGDDVFGYITEDEHVEVHKRSCPVGQKLKSSFGDRIIAVVWGDYMQYSFLASIAFTGIDKLGILNQILSKLSEDVVVNIKSVNVSANDGIFEGVFEVHVHSTEDVNVLCAKIAKVEGVNTVHRVVK